MYIQLKSVGSYHNAIQVAAREIFGHDKKLVHWIYKPNHRSYVPDGQSFIYEVYDEYTMDFSTGTPIKEMVDMEPAVLANANHVFFTSAPLAERKMKHCRAWSVVGNGVAFEIFDAYRVETTDEPDLRRSVGYLGNLSDFFDWQLMADVAEALPQIDFFFHGQVEHHRLEKMKPQVQRLTALPNTYFSGRVSREVGAAAINRYDILIIPFVVNDAMHAVNPLKLWEYFACGKCVVMSPMDAVRIDVLGLHIAMDKIEWLNSLLEIINKNDAYKKHLMEASKEVSWSLLTGRHACLLQNLLTHTTQS